MEAQVTFALVVTVVWIVTILSLLIRVSIWAAIFSTTWNRQIFATVVVLLTAVVPLVALFATVYYILNL